MSLVRFLSRSDFAMFNSYHWGYLGYVIGICLLFGLVQIGFLPFKFIYLSLILAWLPLVWKAMLDLFNWKIGNEFFLAFATLFALIGRQEISIMIILIIMLLASYAELLIKRQTEQALSGILQLIPDEVTILQDQTETVLPLDQVEIGMEAIIKTGRRISVDGIIVQGAAAINEAALTGEGMSKDKTIGERVFAGSFIEAGSIIVRVDRVQKETLFSKMTNLLVEAEQHKAQVTILTERIVNFFIPTYLILIILVWIMTKNFNTVLALLIFGSPLELALITPLAILAGTVAAFRRGILVKGGQALEGLAQVDLMVFDKTGTLTLGEPRVAYVGSYDSSLSEATILLLAAMSEKYSDHVVAKALNAKLQLDGITVPFPDKYNSIVGHGVEVEYQGQRYFFGNKHFIEASEHGNSRIPVKQLICPEEQLHSVFYLASNGQVLGKVCIADVVRQDAKSSINQLFETGIKDITLLSGDRQEIATEVAKQLHIAYAYGDLFPDQKLEFIKLQQQSGRVVGMVGDGINDAAALQQSHVGIALGAMGMEPAINAADIVLMTNELQKVVYVRRLSQQVLKTIKQNLVIGFLLLHAFGLILTLMHVVTPLQAALAHAISDVFILLNASRLISFK